MTHQTVSTELLHVMQKYNNVAQLRHFRGAQHVFAGVCNAVWNGFDLAEMQQPHPA
jgi:hypothetical protein